MTSETTTQRPYLLRAMHEWMTDNGHTPHIIVDASVDGVEVPAQHVSEGKIVLNVSYAAAHNLDLANTGVSFDARFAGEACRVSVPINAVAGIYARETGQGMIFSEEAGPADAAASDEQVSASPDDDSANSSPPDRRAHLKVIK